MYQLLNLVAQRLLPIWLYKKLIGDWNKDGLKKYFKNTSWIFIAKIFSFAVSFFTIAIVARYLGPENLGKLSYAQSFIAIFSILASLGTDQIIYRELINKPEQEATIIGTGIIVKLIFGSITLLSSCIIALLLNEEMLLNFLIGILSLSFILQPFGTVSHVFNARVQSRYNSHITIFVAIIIPIFKLLAIYLGLGILYFAGLILLETLIFVVASLFFYKKIYHKRLLGLSFSNQTCKKLIVESWPLALVGAAGFVYARTDQIMLQNILDSTTVGLYEAAVRLTEPLGFLPGIIIGSVFPALINAKNYSLLEYQKRLKWLSIVCLSISGFLTLSLYILAEPVVSTLFGESFKPTVEILKIYVWSNLGTVAMILIYNYLVAENKTKYLLLLTLSGVLVNIILNLILIPTYGASGAASATLITLLSMITLFRLSLNKMR